MSSLIREKQGEEAFKKYVAELDGEDKEQYNAFMENQVNELSVVVSYLEEAYKLQKSVSNLNVTSLVSNPLKALSAIKSANLAKDQIVYSVKALNWLNETRKTYKAVSEFKGR